jgi:photosystem II stability/assembly factor-like uncharacterized protein
MKYVSATTLNLCLDAFDSYFRAMKRYFTWMAALLLCAEVLAQKNTYPLDILYGMNMRSIGPAAMSGRVTAIDIPEDDENTIYAGTASGGLWRSTDAGLNWEPIFDDQPVQSIGSFAIDPNHPDILWAGTGEGNPRNSQTSGAGIFRSLDKGRTWTCMGLEKTKTIHRVILPKDNDQRVYAAAFGSAWGPNKERGVYRSDDLGVSWKNILFVNDTVGCADLVMDPRNNNKLFAAMYQYERKPYQFKSGGKGSGLYVTHDGGDHWTKLGVEDGLPEGDLGRIGIAIAPSNPNIVYALVEAKQNGIYRSTDGGYHWELMSTNRVGDRPFYYSECYVNPSNPNHIIALQSTVIESIDGGKTWNTLLPYYGVHPDHHAFWWSEKNPKYMIEGNDGGLNISRDGGRNWTFVNNLPVGQFYHVRYDLQTPYHVYGGLQDNGSWVGPAYVWKEGGIRSSDWTEILFGDGFDVAPVPENPRLAYAMYQNGELHRIDVQTGQTTYIKPVADDTTRLRFNWNSALAVVESEPDYIYFGSQFVHLSKDKGLNWEKISPDLTTNDPTKLKQHESGGLTPDQTSAENHCTIICISPRQDDSSIIWVGTDDGNIQLTIDGGDTWELVSKNIRDFPKNAYVAQIIPDVNTTEGAFAVVNNYRQNDWEPYVYYTSNYGKNWQRIVKDRQVSGHCLSLAQDTEQPSLLFLGTEHGLYVSFDFGANWHLWENDYPQVATQDLQIHPEENDLIIATFGRGIYILDDIQPLRMMAENIGVFQQRGIYALPADAQYQACLSRPNGERFPADHFYEGYNRESGANLYFLSTIPFEKKDGKKVTVTIMQDPLDGKEIMRSFQTDLDSGVCWVNWEFDMKGVRFPSRYVPDNKSEEVGGGAIVAPGKYQVKFTCDGYSDSTTFFVEPDPRYSFSSQQYFAYFEAKKKAEAIIEKATKGSDILAELLIAIDRIKGLVKHAPDSTQKKITPVTDSLVKEIERMQLLYFLPENTKGIMDDSKTLVNLLYTMYGYIQPNATGGNTEIMLRSAGEEVNRIVNQINTFLENDWTNWKALIEKSNIQKFPNLERID